MDATTMNYGTVNPAMGMGGMNMYGGNPFPGMPIMHIHILIHNIFRNNPLV